MTEGQWLAPEGLVCGACDLPSRECTCIARPSSRAKRVPVEAPDPVVRAIHARWRDEEQQSAHWWRLVYRLPYCHAAVGVIMLMRRWVAGRSG